jgi:homogentisate 1,2-dioxygenase
VKADLSYMSGFGNEFATEAIKGALPEGQNSPQKPPMGLYAEQLSGSAFTAPSRMNQRTWFYRIQPSVAHSRYRKLTNTLWTTAPDNTGINTPEQLRWDPLPVPSKPTTFWQSITTICSNGGAAGMGGMGIHVYCFNAPMKNQAMMNHDGDFLFIPQEGTLTIRTEMGVLEVAPGEIAVVQRGIKFQVDQSGKFARGYIGENYGSHFELPYRGPIGANGLANTRDFLTPVAAFQDQESNWEIIARFQGEMFATDMKRCPFDVVGWHGNYAPYKYDLARFNTINTVSFDHPDPSIFTVLTSATSIPGTANCDFVIFPPRWMVATDTFRPPWYHRNVMSEYMGLIKGVYDAKPAGGGFSPGSGSLHNCMSAHGPDAEAFTAATNATLKPDFYANTMAFMLESNCPFKPSKFSIDGGLLQTNYLECWAGLKSHFKS